jgi:aerobic carbon-monoxide dehydrogenase medium subunit
VKPSPFTYHRPVSLGQALTMLADLPDAMVLAGGQSLLPILSMRLAAPAHLVDINRLSELSGITTGPDGVAVGALARHAQVERDDAAAAVQPLLRQGSRLVAHPTIRNRGTTVGSLVHADPSGELPAVLALTGGYVTLASTAGRREVSAGEFFVGPLESAHRAGELAVSAFFPALPPRTGSAFVEVARRQGDYAMCGVAAQVCLNPDGSPESARAAYLSCAPTPVVVDLTGLPPADAGEAALAQLDPESDLHASIAYRRQLVRVLTTRALQQARAAAVAAMTAPTTAALREAS